MDFYTLCRFYMKNYTKVQKNQVFKQYLIYSYQLLQIKRSKLKLGSVTFEIKPVLIGGIIFNYSFEMVFSRQPSLNSSKKTVEKILTFFKWHWDFKNVFTLIIASWFTLNYFVKHFTLFYNTYITGSLLDEEHLNIVLNQIFTLLETQPLNTTFFLHSSNVLAELSLYLNLF